MKRVEGFFLIELMVSLLCAVFLMSIFIGFVQSSWLSVRKTTQSTMVSMRLAMLLEQIRRDIQSAPIMKEYWHKCCEKHLIWSTLKNTAISWQIKSSTFIRKEGKYNPDKKTWSHASTVHFSIPTGDGNFQIYASPESHYNKSIINVICVDITTQHRNEKMSIKPKGEYFVGISI